MNEAQFAMILAQAAMMNCEVAGLVAENQHHAKVTGFVTYGEEAFQQLYQKYEHVLGFDAIAQLTNKGY